MLQVKAHMQPYLVEILHLFQDGGNTLRAPAGNQHVKYVIFIRLLLLFRPTAGYPSILGSLLNFKPDTLQPMPDCGI